MFFCCRLICLRKLKVNNWPAVIHTGRSMHNATSIQFHRPSPHSYLWIEIGMQLRASLCNVCIYITFSPRIQCPKIKTEISCINAQHTSHSTETNRNPNGQSVQMSILLNLNIRISATEWHAQNTNEEIYQNINWNKDGLRAMKLIQKQRET